MQKYYIASISMEKIQWSIKKVYRRHVSILPSPFNAKF